jgi:non-heme chloroperoxidase
MPHWLLSDGTPLYYEDAGAGPVIVFVPGWTFTTRVWTRQTTALADRFRVIACDLRGAGRSGKTPAGHGFSRYAKDLHELFVGLNLKDITLVGWAMGATVAMHYTAMSDVSGRVERLIWVDHSPRFYALSDWPFALYGSLTPETLERTLDQLLADRPGATNALLDDIFSEGIGDEDRQAFYTDSFMTPTSVAVRMLGSAAATDLRPYLGSLRLPCLFVNGARSVVPSGVGRWMAGQVVSGRHAVLQEAGHAPFWDQPRQFNALVEEFIGASTKNLEVA